MGILTTTHRRTYVDDPVLPYVYWRDVPSFYGPLWTEVSAVIASIAAESIPRGVLLFRLVAAASALACGGLIWLVLRDRGAQTATAGAALWLWNPLVPLEAGMSGHNDLLLMLFLLAAVWAAQQQKIVLSGACWASAFFIKAIAALMLPIVGLIWLVGGKGPQALGKSAGLAIVGVLIVMLGLFVAGRSPLEGSGVGVLGADTVRYTNSVHELILAEARVLMGEMPDDVRAPLYFHTWRTQLSQPTGLWSSSGSVRQLIASLPDGASLLVVAPAENEWTRVFEPSTGRVGYVPSIRLLDEVMPGEIEVMNADSARAAWTSRSHLADANTLIRASAYAAFAVGFLVIALQVLKRGGGAWATAFTSLFLVFLLATATWIWSWYILWPLGFAALSPSTRAVRLTLILSASSLLIYPLFSYQGTDMWWAFNFRSAVVWVFPVIAWWVSERMLESRNRRSLIPLGDAGRGSLAPSAQGLPGGARKGTPLRSA